MGLGVGRALGVVGDALGFGELGLADGRADVVEGAGVGDGGAGIVEVGVGLGDGETEGEVDGVPPVLLAGLGESDGVGVAEVEVEGESEPLGLGVTSARAGRASVRQTTAVNAATALRRATR